MHGRPRPPKDQPADHEREKAAHKRVCFAGSLWNVWIGRIHVLQLCFHCRSTAWQTLRAGAVQLALFSRLCIEVLARRAAQRYDEESLALASALLEQNPEVYTAWNFRREALQQALKVQLLCLA